MAFPRFVQLTLETREIFWELCVRNPTTTVHFAGVKHRTVVRGSRRGPPSQVVHLERSCAPHSEETLTALLHATSRSRAIALRHQDGATPVESALVHGRKTTSESSQFPLPELHINATTDRVILEEYWNQQVDRVHSLSPRIEYPDQLRYLAVSWKPPNLKPGIFENPPLESLHRGILGLLTVYWRLHVLYVLVDP